MTHSADHLKKMQDAWADSIGSTPEEFYDASFDYIDALEYRLDLIKEALKRETDNGFGNYMVNIDRAFKGKSSKQRKPNA